MTKTYRYPWTALRGDYIRTGAGIVMTGLPLIASWGDLYAGLILGGLMAVFVVFGLRTWIRQSSAYEVGDEGIARSGSSLWIRRRMALRWQGAERIKLSFYSTRRDRSQGWMHLRIGGQKVKFGIDSIIEGFDDIATRTANAAAMNGIILSDATLRNFAALGVVIEHEDGRAVSASRAGVL